MSRRRASTTPRRAALVLAMSTLVIAWFPVGAAPIPRSLAEEIRAAANYTLNLSDSESVSGDEPSADGESHDGHGGHSRLTDQYIPLQLEGFPQRPRPLIELGPNYLGTGNIRRGIELPTGAVWQPALLMFGTFRTAIQTFDRVDRTTEWANRLDLFFNLQLSGTERLVVGFRPFDENGRFSSYFFQHPNRDLEGEFDDNFNGEIDSLFFEGDFGEIFPNLSKRDFARTDIGFSAGRQPMFFQEGMLFNDVIDGIGLTRNTLLPSNTSNVRLTFFWGFNEVGRGALGANTQDLDGHVLALLTSTDFRSTTMDVDAAYVTGDDDIGDLATAGVSFVQRTGHWNSSIRLLGSYAPDQESAFATDGALFFAEISTTPRRTHNLLYFTVFGALDEFVSAARGPATGGPLGRAGINFASVGLGNFGAPLSSRARDVAGGALGYQWFFDDTRKQVIAEIGARAGLERTIDDSAAATVRYQMALGRNFITVIDAFYSYMDNPVTNDTLDSVGGRIELVTQF